MYKQSLFYFFGFFVLLSCGEAGFQSDISKNVELDPVAMNLTVPAILVGQTISETPPVTFTTGQVDITGDEFADFLSDADFFRINQSSYSINNFPAGSSADLEFTIEVSIGGGPFQPFLTENVQNAQNNVKDVILYTSENPGNVNQSTVSQMEAALLSGQTFEMQVEVVGRNVTLQTTSVDFELIFKYDVTTRIQLNQ